MRVTDSVVVRAPLEDVWAWWSDFGDAGHVSRVWHGLAMSRRRVLAADAERIVFDEEVPLVPGRLRVGRRTLALTKGEETHRLHESGAGAVRFEADWAFKPHARGTLVVRTVDVRPGWTSLVPRALARWVMSIDLRHHARGCERDLRRARRRRGET